MTKNFMKMFPILQPLVGPKDLNALRFIPWGAIAPYEGRAIRYHGQPLQTLSDRGGLSPAEICAVILGGKATDYDDEAATAMVHEIAIGYIAIIRDDELKEMNLTESEIQAEAEAEAEIEIEIEIGVK